jgi:hypothetical protein
VRETVRKNEAAELFEILDNPAGWTDSAGRLRSDYKTVTSGAPADGRAR